MKKIMSIMIAALIIGISLVVIQCIKQHSIEKQQVLEIEQELLKQQKIKQKCIEECEYDFGEWSYNAYFHDMKYGGNLQRILDNAPENTTLDGIIAVFKYKGYTIKKGWIMNTKYFPTQETCEKSCINNYSEHSIIEQIE